MRIRTYPSSRRVNDLVRPVRRHVRRVFESESTERYALERAPVPDRFFALQASDQSPLRLVLIRSLFGQLRPIGSTESLFLPFFHRYTFLEVGGKSRRSEFCVVFKFTDVLFIPGELEQERAVVLVEFVF